MSREQRSVEVAVVGDEDLGPLKLLPGRWENKPNLQGRGWNMIALPSVDHSGLPFNYRLLMNQYNEVLKFTVADKSVKNRGIGNAVGSRAIENTDQIVVALDYEQSIAQISSDDFPPSEKAGGSGLPIHHEPGLWLHMMNETSDDIDIARLASIPHGDSALALGRSTVTSEPVKIPHVNGFPTGGPTDLDNPYFRPYRHYVEAPFKGVEEAPGLPGFSPAEPEALLKAANSGVNIARTTILEVDTTLDQAGISNIPFIVRQANAVNMKSTFWIQELEQTDDSGHPVLRLQYLQIVMLDFFNRQDGSAGMVAWPHISINTLEKVAGPEVGMARMPVPDACATGTR